MNDKFYSTNKIELSSDEVITLRVLRKLYPKHKYFTKTAKKNYGQLWIGRPKKMNTGFYCGKETPITIDYCFLDRVKFKNMTPLKIDVIVKEYLEVKIDGVIFFRRKR